MRVFHQHNSWPTDPLQCCSCNFGTNRTGVNSSSYNTNILCFHVNTTCSGLLVANKSMKDNTMLDSFRKTPPPCLARFTRALCVTHTHTHTGLTPLPVCRMSCSCSSRHRSDSRVSHKLARHMYCATHVTQVTRLFFTCHTTHPCFARFPRVFHHTPVTRTFHTAPTCFAVLHTSVWLCPARLCMAVHCLAMCGCAQNTTVWLCNCTLLCVCYPCRTAVGGKRGGGINL